VLPGVLLLFAGQYEREAAKSAEWLEGAWVLDAADTHLLYFRSKETAGETATQFALHPGCQYGLVLGNTGVVGVVTAPLALSLGNLSPHLPLSCFMDTDVEQVSTRTPLSLLCTTLTWRHGTVYVIKNKDTIAGILCPRILFRALTLAVEEEPMPQLFHQVHQCVAR